LKRFTMLLMAFTLLLSLSLPHAVDAKGYRAPRKSFTPTKPSTNISKNNPATSTTKTPFTNPSTNRGFFSGGGFLKGMMIGGLAGMLFGGMFGGMGAFGNMLGFMINLLAIALLIALIIKLFSYFRTRRKPDDKRY
jgi:predicted lipid-binding transport protein (Tim44 family)